ncbi:MAG: M23 family metallopeptidase [Bacteroidia bacterium]|jgi:murein DD-endopeptidase MepM/ murein hydrolase activator NlpD|nr:M23 family metallopeptidase [Bacteroidia bacterium]
MARTKYFYNPKSLSFEKVSENRRYMIWRVIGFSALIIVSVGLTALVLAQFLTEKFDNSSAASQSNTLSAIRSLEKQIESLDQQISDLQQKDVEVYRAIYGVDPPKLEKLEKANYNALLKLSYGDNLKKLHVRMDQIKSLVATQEKSYKQLDKLIKNRSDLVNSIPAIMPVANKDLKRMASGFGYRLDPFYHTFSFHGGMDFTAEVGTEVYATGDGRVSKVSQETWGYGNHIIVQHGHGYTTLYGHLSRFAVRAGEKVKRGQLIGYVGNTGRSTGPHLHYEVRKNDNPLNPAFFYRNDLTDEQYQQMLELSQREANRFD